MPGAVSPKSLLDMCAWGRVPLAPAGYVRLGIFLRGGPLLFANLHQPFILLSRINILLSRMILLSRINVLLSRANMLLSRMIILLSKVY